MVLASDLPVYTHSLGVEDIDDVAIKDERGNYTIGDPLLGT